jgi:crotonobetainyl-CoA:carnitine CoA-transferase CaiB-like acyl-CoA transferase
VAPPAALAGLRVLDASEGVSGPHAAKLLADFGAEVLKVERPRRGDPARREGPFRRDRPDPNGSGAFLHRNTNKRGITLDLAQPTGRRIFRHLAAQSDVVVESYDPGVMAGWGLGYADLCPLQPRLVYVSVTPFGQDGPYAGWKAGELIDQAIGGPFMYSQGKAEREPLKYAENSGRYYAGVMAAIATLAAAFTAKFKGVSQQVDLSIVQALLSSTENKPIHYQYTGEILGRVDNAGRWSYLMGAYPCADGFIGVQGSGRGETWWPRVYRMIGRPELEQDPRFATPEARRAHRDEFDVLWYTWLAEHTRAEIFAAAQAARFPLAPVYTPEDLLHDPHYQARAFFVPLDDPDAGPLTLPGAPFQLSATPWRLRRPAPRLGQHNRQVLIAELGFSPAEVIRLHSTGVT